MTSAVRVAWFGLCLVILILGPGCTPTSHGKLDETKEAFFIKGKSLLNSRDYKGAVEAFEKAIEVNPRSAAAHFEMGVLYEEELKDYAAAIYHFEKHLRLQPNSRMEDIIRQRITGCKQELAKSVPFALLDDRMQREVERMTTENNDLRSQVAQLESQLAAKEKEVNELKQRPAPSPQTVGEALPSPTPRTVAPVTESPASTGWKMHAVRPSETFYSIARDYSVNLRELERANPGVDSRRLRIGQQIRIPPR